ncbi:MAG: response regulator transcription factor [Candidatus Dormibacteraeota bacterium]|nr:response regulator transcription factor [Candidatus Dormibacteraeota bacterium]
MRILVVAAGLAAQADLTALLEGVAGVELVGATVPASAAVDASRLQPDLVVVHLDPADDAGLTAIEALSADRHPVPVLALLDGASTEDALMAGAYGVLPAGVDEARIAAALQVLGQGLAVLGREELRRMVAPEPPTGAGEVPVERLTSRESEVLQLLALGLTNAEIAARLRISAHTAKFHVGAVLGKLGARSRADAVARAARLGWIVV